MGPEKGGNNEEEAEKPKPENARKSGFGFVNFEKAEDAEKCVNELNGKEIKVETPEKNNDGEENDKENDAQPNPYQKPWILYVARAQKKKEREQELKKAREEAKAE